jgi:hypothetical protein
MEEFLMPNRSNAGTPAGHRSIPWLVVAFAAAALAIGLPFWSIPYARLNLPGALYGAGLWCVAAGALALRAVGVASVPKATLVMGAAVPTAVLLRVAVETAGDPTSHNLWPLEVVIAGALGLACALAGTLPGWLFARLTRGTWTGTP